MQIDGIRCPSCGCTTSTVIETRIVEDGRKRRRKCTRCKETFYSWEFAEDKVPDFEAKELAKLVDNLETLIMRALAIVQLSKQKLGDENGKDEI